MSAMKTTIRPVDAFVFEPLEPRVLLAGNVTTVMAAGSLFVTGDHLANDIHVWSPGPGQVSVGTGANPTTINGVSAVYHYLMTGDVYVFLNAGDDVLDLNSLSAPRDLTIYGGPGNTYISADPLSVGRNFSVFNSTGNDDLWLNHAVVTGSVLIDNSLGAGNVGFDNSTVGGVTVLSAGDNSLFLTATTLNGSLFMSTAFGGARLDIGNSTIHGSATFSHAGGGAAPAFAGWASVVFIDPTTIDGNLTVLNGAGDDAISLDHVTLHGNLFASQGPDAASLNLDHCTVDGSITQVRGEGGDLLAQPGYASLVEFSTCTVGGVTLLNGSGVDALSVNSVTFNGSLFVQNGPGAASTSFSLVTVNGGVTLLRGEGGTLPTLPGWSSLVDVNSVTVTRDVMLINGSGNDAFTTNLCTINGALSVYDGLDGGYVSLSSTTLDGALNFYRGSGGDLTGMSGYAGALMFSSVTLHRSLTFLNGSGDEVLTGNNVTIDGSVLVDFGPDAASVSFTNAVIGGALTLLRGYGGELATIPGVAGAFFFNSATLGQNVLLVSGSGDEQAVFNTCILDAGALFNLGHDALQMVLDHANVAGAMTVFRGEGGSIGTAPAYASQSEFTSSSVGGALAIYHGSGLDSVSFDHFTAHGNAGVNAGPGGIEVGVVTSTFLGSLGLSNLSGVGAFSLGASAALSTVAGGLSVSSGSSVDEVVLRRLSVTGATSIDTGAGADTVAVDDSSLTGAFTLDTGDGADTVDIERVGASVGLTAFAVFARVNTGPGADTIRIGINADATAKAVFTLGLNLDGGLGTDTFDYLTGGNTFSVAPVVTNVETIV